MGEAQLEYRHQPRRAVEAIADFETPALLLDLDGVTWSYQTFADIWERRFESFDVAYSFKTNPLGVITNRLREIGALAEVVSGMELAWALEDGYDDGEIIFNGPLKLDEELRRANRHNAVINVDSERDFKRLRRTTDEKRARVGVRVATEDGEGAWNRFGVKPSRAVDLIDRAGEADDLEPVAVHQHIGTNIADPDRYQKSCKRLAPVARHLFEWTDPADCLVDIGGGYPVMCTRPSDATEWSPPPLDAFADAVVEGLGTVGNSRARVLTEPGRAIVEPHGHLVCRVCDVYDINGDQAVVVDAGTNVVPSAFAYDRPITFVTAEDTDETTTTYDVYGPLCLQADRLGSDVPGPTDLAVGDYAVIHGVGGYDIPGAYSWIRPVPPILVSYNNEIGLVRERPTPQSVRALEREGVFDDQRRRL